MPFLNLCLLLASVASLVSANVAPRTIWYPETKDLYPTEPDQKISEPRPCTISVPNCLCDMNDKTNPIINCSIIEKASDLKKVFNETNFKWTSKMGADVIVNMLGSDVTRIPKDTFGDVKIRSLVLSTGFHPEIPEIPEFDFDIFSNSKDTLTSVTLSLGGTTTLTFPDDFRFYQKFTTLNLKSMNVYLENLASITLEEINIKNGQILTLQQWDLPNLKHLTSDGPFGRPSGNLPEYFASSLNGLRELHLGNVGGKDPLLVNKAALRMPSFNVDLISLENAYFVPGSFAIRNYKIAVMVKYSSVDPPPGYYPVWDERVGREVLETLANGQEVMRVRIGNDADIECPCNIGWLLRERRLLPSIEFNCTSVAPNPARPRIVSIQEATPEDICSGSDD